MAETAAPGGYPAPRNNFAILFLVILLLLLFPTFWGSFGY